MFYTPKQAPQIKIWVLALRCGYLFCVVHFDQVERCCWILYAVAVGAATCRLSGLSFQTTVAGGCAAPFIIIIFS